MNTKEREQYWFNLEEELLLGGLTLNKWCTYVSKSVYDALLSHADLAVIITATVCIETYLKTEYPDSKNKTLS
jgi:hypothetical protein